MPKVEAGPNQTFVAAMAPLVGLAKCLLAFLCFCLVPAAWAAPSQMFTTQATNSTLPFPGVLTQHNDNSRTGANLNESIFNINNVNTNQFGLGFTRASCDRVDAQP